MTIFVDTGVLLAGAVRREARHAEATALLDRVGDDAAFTTDHVVVEAWNLSRRRYGWPAAMRLWGALRHVALRIESVTLADLERGQTIGDAWKEHEFDIVDCTSFAAMERLGCKRAATFDADFAIYRYGPDRRFAFEIVRD